MTNKGWHGEPRRHGLARKGVKTVIDKDTRLAVNKYVSNGKKVYCPKCKEEIWDKSSIDQRLNKCWNCGIRFDNEETQPFVFYHKGELGMRGEGLTKTEYEGEIQSLDRTLECLLNDISQDIPEFNNEEYNFGLYFSSRWNADDVGDIMLDHNCDAPDKLVDKINDWLNKNVKVVREK